MKLGEKKDIRPLLIKFGVAITLSIAGFLYSRLRTQRPKPSLPPSLPCSSDDSSEGEIKGNARCKDDFPALNSISSSCSSVSVAAQKNEDSNMPKIAVDNSMLETLPSSRHSGDNNGLLLPEFNDLVKGYDFASSNSGFSPRKDVETPRSDVETPKAFRNSETDDYEQEVRQLTNMVKMLRERERNLEIQLLEYYGLKEQETAVMELQNRLKINNMEAKLLTLKIDALQVDNQRLEAQVADHAKVVAELEAARSKIKLLKKKLRSEAEHNKEQILALKKRVVKLQEQDHEAAATDPDVQSKLQRLKVLEEEAEDLRKANMRLQQENSELAQRLDSAQMLAISVMEDPQATNLKEMSECLKQENETLGKKIEQLQADKCAGAEELVYLKWINACLRYELRNYQPPAGKTVARDLSKTLSPQSEEKAKRLIVEYANTEGAPNMVDFDSEWSSSQTSYITDSEIHDDSSADKSSGPKSNNSSTVKFFKKLRKLVRGKDVNNQNRASSGYLEDGDSSGVSTGTSAAAEAQTNKLASLSETSSRHSFDIQRLRRVKEYDMVDEGSGYKRFALHRSSTTDVNEGNQFVQDADLLKFAKVLKVSHAKRRKKLRSSSSFSFG